jgi:uncharacterized spore protein YtfJ
MQTTENVTERGQELDHVESGSFLERFAKTLGASARASTVFGDPVERNGTTVIPVATARWGFGGGSGQHRDERGRGGGGGVIVQPVGFIEMTSSGAHFHRIRSAATTPLAILSVLLVVRWLLRR